MHCFVRNACVWKCPFKCVSADIVLLWRAIVCSNLHVWVRACCIIDFVFTFMSLLISPTDNMHYLLNISHSYCGVVSLWENFVEACVSHRRDRYRDTAFWTQTTLPSSCHIVLQVASLNLILLTWRIWWAPNNASKWQMGFNLAFKGLNTLSMPMFYLLKLPTLMYRHSYEWHVKRKAHYFVWRDF